MRRAFVGISRKVFNALYRARTRRTQREDMAVFLSRQANEPSYDFQQIAREFERRGWKARMHLKKVSKRNLPSYAGHVLSEIRLLATCKVAILDRYDPVVSLLEFESESPDAASVVHGQIAHQRYPVRPVVLQLWHAFGAYKKFGYQSVGTREGHSREVTDVFDIHRNYSWVVCSGSACREAFAEAFSYPVERVVPLNRPEYDEIRSLGRAVHEQGAREAGDRPVILMAPTLRKSQSSAHPFRDLHADANAFESGVPAHVVWSFHPLESGLPAPGNVSDLLLEADVLVTDYSSIVYEAFLLDKKVVFYVPDIDLYRVSPGLNDDPLVLCPEICVQSEAELAEMLKRIIADPDSYPEEALARFAARAFDPPCGQPVVERIVDFCIEHASRPAGLR